MRKPVVGVIGSTYRVEDRYSVQMAGEHNLRAIADVTGALPLVFSGIPEITDIGALLDTVDGILLTGARANVHPSRFGETPHEAYEPYDERRDDVALQLSQICVEQRIPLLGICRGMQELAVAFGSALHPEIRDLPGKMNHRMPRLENGEIHPDPEVIFQDRHDVTFIDDGQFANLYGTTKIRVNSLHGQGVVSAGERVVVEGVAEDETVEAISIKEAAGFALGVQWHAEYDPQTNPVNQVIMSAFGEAVRETRA
ncbi:MAG: gamma-glutamyl-gamma-aminobutyrate hydrolase family protein [Pseudomonadota bacterium]